MGSLEYHRPRTLEDALNLLEQGVPLGGGTHLSTSLREVTALIDLQDLDLGGIEVSSDSISFGGTTTLQNLVEAADQLPSELVQTARLEAGWNIRNQATVAGTIVTGDGRSPLLTALLAMGTEIALAPGDEQISLDETLRRSDRAGGKLITRIRAVAPDQLRYAQVARSPVDRPQVCVAVARSGGQTRVALGGFGQAPLLLPSSDAPSIAEAARTKYADAGDQWASSEFRSAVAAILAERLVAAIDE